MLAEQNEKRFTAVLNCLCKNISRRLLPLAPKLADSVQEIRLRLSRPLALVCPDNTYYLTQNGGLSNTILNGAMLVVSKADIVDTFNNICNYSVYNRQNEIVNGFVTMYGGHRAGICGTAVVNNGKIVNIRDITSINVRIAREHKGCADSLYNKIIAVSGGVLICGAPCSGKTTVLRDLTRLLSTKGKKNVALIDERGELAGTASGKFQNDIGMCDVYDSYNKSEAMLHAIRSMAPEIVICDEIGSKEDIYAVEKSVNCGVRIISSTHCANEYELKQKANMVSLMKTGAFQTLVFLSNRTHAGEIVKISQVGDNFAV